MTVGQIKKNMTSWELQGWVLFEQKYGLLHEPSRIERAIAQAVVPFLKNAKVEQLAPWPKFPAPEEPEAKISDLFDLLKAKAKKKPVYRKVSKERK